MLRQLEIASCREEMEKERRLTLGNLNCAGADPADDITQKIFFHFVLGKPTQYRQVSE